MKRFVKIISIAALFVCGMMMTGCAAANNIKEALSGPKDTWFSREINYKPTTSSEGMPLVVYMRYSDSEYTGHIKTGNITLQSGLNVIIIAKDQNITSPIVDGLIGGKFLLANFSDAQPSTVEGGTDDGEDTTVKTIKMSTTKWNLLYNSVTMVNEGPSLDIFGQNSLWEKMNKPESFSWKKIMANYLLDRLLED